MSITTQLLLTFIATLTANSNGNSNIPDLCDVRHPKVDMPLRCEPHAEGAPVYDSTVCCDKQTCWAASAGAGCPAGRSLYYCELGAVRSSDKVDCYFEVPEFCEVFACPSEPPPGFDWYAEDDSICCEWGICTPYVFGVSVCEEQNIYGCGSLVCNPDGTVTCIDWEEG